MLNLHNMKRYLKIYFFSFGLYFCVLLSFGLVLKKYNKEDSKITAKSDIFRDKNYQSSFIATFGDDDDFAIGHSLVRTLKANKSEYYSCLPQSEYGYNDILQLTTRSVTPSACSDHVTIVLLIKSSVYRNSLRQILRRTWAQEVSLPNRLLVRRLFLMGSPSKGERSIMVEEESRLYKDILQGQFEDVYKSVAQKVALGLKFVKYNCRNVKLIVVVDDDSIIFPWNFLYLIDRKFRYGDGEHFYGGFQFGGRVNREPTFRWRLSESEYKCEFYPPYLGGSMYAMSYNTAMRLYHLAHVYRMIFLEDVFFGVMASVGNVTLTPFSHDYIGQSCPLLQEPHGILNFNLTLDLVGCHGADSVSMQESVWQEYCYQPIRTDRSILQTLYCSRKL